MVLLRPTTYVARREGGVRGVAFIVSPAIPPALHGKEATGLAHAVDWAPTLLRIAGVGVNSSGGVLLHGIDGLDMVRLSTLNRSA